MVVITTYTDICFLKDFKYYDSSNGIKDIDVLISLSNLHKKSQVIYIGSDLPDEYTGSNYTYKFKGTVAKAKANATQGIKEMIEIATNKKARANDKEKHKKETKFG